MMVGSRWRCLVEFVGPDGIVWATRAMTGIGNPDLRDVEEIARLQLRATRRGGGVVLDAVCPRLLELIELAGLPVEMRGKTEHRKELRCVQKDVETDDPTA
jgi:hypothetical protein